MLTCSYQKGISYLLRQHRQFIYCRKRCECCKSCDSDRTYTALCTTGYDGISLDYNVAVLTDCCSSNTDDIQQSNLRDMANIGAFLLTSDDFLAGQEPPDLARQVQSLVLADPTPPEP